MSNPTKPHPTPAAAAPAPTDYTRSLIAAHDLQLVRFALNITNYLTTKLDKAADQNTAALTAHTRADQDKPSPDAGRAELVQRLELVRSLKDKLATAAATYQLLTDLCSPSQPVIQSPTKRSG